MPKSGFQNFAPLPYEMLVFCTNCLPVCGAGGGQPGRADVVGAKNVRLLYFLGSRPSKPRNSRHFHVLNLEKCETVAIFRVQTFNCSQVLSGILKYSRVLGYNWAFSNIIEYSLTFLKCSWVFLGFSFSVNMWPPLVLASRRVISRLWCENGAVFGGGTQEF